METHAVQRYLVEVDSVDDVRPLGYKTLNSLGPIHACAYPLNATILDFLGYK